MLAKIQFDSKWAYLYSTKDNKVLKSVKLPVSGGTVIATTRLKVWARNNGIKVN